MLKFLKCSSYIVVLLAALNLGSAGIFEFNLVSYLLGAKTRGAKIAYAAVSLCAVISALTTCLCHIYKEKESAHEAVPVNLNI